MKHSSGCSGRFDFCMLRQYIGSGTTFERYISTRLTRTTSMTLPSSSTAPRSPITLAFRSSFDTFFRVPITYINKAPEDPKNGFSVKDVDDRIKSIRLSESIKRCSFPRAYDRDLTITVPNPSQFRNWQSFFSLLLSLNMSLHAFARTPSFLVSYNTPDLRLRTGAVQKVDVGETFNIKAHPAIATDGSPVISIHCMIACTTCSRRRRSSALLCEPRNQPPLDKLARKDAMCEGSSSLVHPSREPRQCRINAHCGSASSVSACMVCVLDGERGGVGVTAGEGKYWETVINRGPIYDRCKVHSNTWSLSLHCSASAGMLSASALVATSCPLANCVPS